MEAEELRRHLAASLADAAEAAAAAQAAALAGEAALNERDAAMRQFFESGVARLLRKQGSGGVLRDEDAVMGLTRELCAVADDVCGGRLVSSMEGGYNLEALAEAVAAHVTELMEV